MKSLRLLRCQMDTVKGRGDEVVYQQPLNDVDDLADVSRREAASTDVGEASRRGVELERLMVHDINARTPARTPRATEGHGRCTHLIDTVGNDGSIASVPLAPSRTPMRECRDLLTRERHLQVVAHVVCLVERVDPEAGLPEVRKPLVEPDRA